MRRERQPNSRIVLKLCQTSKNKKAATFRNGLSVNVGAEGFEPPTLCL
jgi:hypothetical protein